MIFSYLVNFFYRLLVAYSFYMSIIYRFFLYSFLTVRLFVSGMSTSPILG